VTNTLLIDNNLQLIAGIHTWST